MTNLVKRNVIFMRYRDVRVNQSIATVRGDGGGEAERNERHVSSTQVMA
jgi:hypothetical protein